MFGGAFAGGNMGGFDLGCMFGGGGRQAFRRGPDLQVRVRIPFRESVKGTQQELKIPMRDVTGRQTTRKVTVNIPAGANSEKRWGSCPDWTATVGVRGAAATSQGLEECPDRGQPGGGGGSSSNQGAQGLSRWERRAGWGGCSSLQLCSCWCKICFSYLLKVLRGQGWQITRNLADEQDAVPRCGQLPKPSWDWCSAGTGQTGSTALHIPSTSIHKYTVLYTCGGVLCNTWR